MLGYQKQGILQAEELKDHPNQSIADQAQAYSPLLLLKKSSYLLPLSK